MMFPDIPSGSSRVIRQSATAACGSITLREVCDQLHPYTIPRFRVHPPPIVSTISAFSIKGRQSRYEVGVLFVWVESVYL